MLVVIDCKVFFEKVVGSQPKAFYYNFCPLSSLYLINWLAPLDLTGANLPEHTYLRTHIVRGLKICSGKFAMVKRCKAALHREQAALNRSTRALFALRVPTVMSVVSWSCKKGMTFNCFWATYLNDKIILEWVRFSHRQRCCLWFWCKAILAIQTSRRNNWTYLKEL